MEGKRIVFIQTTLAHYYPSRLLAVADACQREGFIFDNIELSGSIGAYPWFQTAEHSEFSNITLFPDMQFEKIPEEKLWLKLKECLEKLNPDVVFLFGYSLKVMRKAKTWCERKGIATVLVSVSNQFDKKRYAPIEFLKYLFIRRFDAAFVSGQTASAYIQKLGIPKERVVLGCDVLDVKALARQVQCAKENLNQIREKWTLPAQYFLFVGRLIPVKNIIGLLSAFESFLKMNGSHNGWHLVICGSGDEQQTIDTFLQQVPLEHRARVHSSGFIGPDSVVDFYSAASFLILPSISEPWGLVVNEAMICGLPVIASNRVGCALDLVREGENGWIVDPFDYEQMAKVIMNAANMDESRRQEFGRRSRELISNWDLDRFGRGTIECSKIALAHVKKKNKG